MISPLTKNRTIYSDCPCCGYKQSLSVSTKDGRTLYHCHAGCPPDSLWGVIRGKKPLPYQPRPKTHQRVIQDSIAAFIAKLWAQSLPAGGTVVETYLAKRGLGKASPRSLRYLPNCQHKPSGASYPVMLAAVTDIGGNLKALHRTYLSPDGNGKAPVEPAKMTLGAVGGLSCHLAPVGEELVVAEGIETALSVQEATGIPAWAALSAGGMRNLILPPLPLASTIIIAADNDPVGMRSAKEAGFMWREDGRHVRIALPPQGKDFNDIINEEMP